MPETKIFLSIGTTANKLHQQLADTVESYVKMHDLLPQTVGRTYFSSKQPLVAIKELMHECAGSIILAYERTHLVEAVDKRGSENERQLAGLNLPTVWNQIEATMAYTLGHPLLVLAEEGMKYEGLLEPNYDWYVMYIKPEENLLTSNEFQMVFADWKRRVLAYQAQKEQQQERGETAVIQGQVPHNLLVHLRQVLADRFSPGDLQTLCFDLGVPYENLSGEEHRLKVLSLIQTLERTNRIDELITFGQKIRPDVPWQLTN
ncbi:MAG: hypothetical protein H6657_06460 [Ardenticatenaceae bacterium]|nr:hypothetical protein [Ardenticatenaceae bacterium]